jgi:peptidoglycan/LPS O-acetylase OafA/YrhL
MLVNKSLRGTAASDHLDMVRGVAAIAVTLAHLRQGFFVDPKNIRGPSNLLIKIVYFVTAFGHYSVMIFFVLSGYLVGRIVLRGRMDGDFSWSDYATNRLTRLWIVLIPALIIGAIWDHIGIHLFGTSGIYGGLATNHSDAVPPHLSAGVMLGNAFFMQGIGTLTFGSNGPLWSLSYEFWYYVLFPLMVLAFPLGKAGWTSVLYGAAACVVALFIAQPMRAYFLIWLLGATINLAPEERGKPGYLWVAAAVGSAVLVVAALNFKTDLNACGDFAVGAAAAVLIFAILRSSARSRSGFYSRAARGLAGFSYTLYLVHAPLMVFVSAWLVPPQMWQPNGSHVAIGAALAIVTFAYALLIARFTEWRTDAMRRRVADALGHRASSHGPLHSSPHDG